MDQMAFDNPSYDPFNAPIAVVAGGADDGMAVPFRSNLFGTDRTTTTTATTMVTPVLSDSTVGTLASTVEALTERSPSLGVASHMASISSSSSSRRRHMAAAVFYGECSREGLPHDAAEKAAQDMKGRYRRWWVDSVATNKKSTTTRKRPRDTFEQQPSNKNTDSARGVIDRVSRRQKLQGGGYLFPQPATKIGSIDGDAKEISENNAGGVNVDEQKNISLVIDGAPLQISLAPTINELEYRRAGEIKSKLLSTITNNTGDISSKEAQEAIQNLQSFYQKTGCDARSKRSVLSGTWLALSRPAYNGCLGMNTRQHYQYTLGRLSFDMFRPINLKCSIQANLSSIQIIEGPQGIPDYIPRRLRSEVKRCGTNLDGSALRTYTITVVFCIEPNQTTTGESVPDEKEKQTYKQQQTCSITRPLRGIMKNQGYMLPDPKVSNRLSIWFTEGTLEFNDKDADLEEWKRVFSKAPHRSLHERANILAARLLLGATVPDTIDEDGTMKYELRRPIGGHGLAFCDVLYLDEDLRVLRGHGGQVYVCSRLVDEVVPDSTSEPDDEPN